MLSVTEIEEACACVRSDNHKLLCSACTRVATTNAFYWMLFGVHSFAGVTPFLSQRVAWIFLAISGGKMGRA